MGFDVTDGRIPDKVVDWLREELHLSVAKNPWYGRHSRAQPYLLRHWDPASDMEDEWAFPWPWHMDREPTVGEALALLASGIDVRA